MYIKNDGSFHIDCKSYTSGNWIHAEPFNKYTVTGNFKNLGINSVSTKVDGDNLLIYANCYSGDCLNQINNDGTIRKNNSTLICLIDITSDKSLVERCQKAFSHLIKLCGGKNEAF